MDIEKAIKECFRNAGIFLASDCDDNALTRMDIDSFTFISLMVEIENHFEIAFPDEMLSKEMFSSLSGFAKLVAQLKAED